MYMRSFAVLNALCVHKTETRTLLRIWDQILLIKIIKISSRFLTLPLDGSAFHLIRILFQKHYSVYSTVSPSKVAGMYS